MTDCRPVADTFGSFIRKGNELILLSRDQNLI